MQRGTNECFLATVKSVIRLRNILTYLLTYLLTHKRSFFHIISDTVIVYILENLSLTLGVLNWISGISTSMPSTQ